MRRASSRLVPQTAKREIVMTALQTETPWLETPEAYRQEALINLLANLEANADHEWSTIRGFCDTLGWNSTADAAQSMIELRKEIAAWCRAELQKRPMSVDELPLPSTLPEN